MDKNEREFQILMVQYKECLAFIRNLDVLVWEVFSVTVAINSFLILAYMQSPTQIHAKIAILTVSIVFTAIAFVTLVKHRFFQEVKVRDFRELQKTLMNDYRMREIRVITRDIMEHWKDYEDDDPKFRLRPFFNPDISAFKYFAGALIILLCGLSILLFLDVCRALGFVLSFGLVL